MIDIYTKIVLTIIAVCLLAITLHPIISPIPVTASSIQAVDIAKVGGRDVWQEIPVKIVD